MVPDPALDVRGHSSADLRLWTHDSREFLRQTDAGPGFPQRPLSREDHLRRFQDCMEFATVSPAAETATELVDSIGRLETLEDVRELLPLFG